MLIELFLRFSARFPDFPLAIMQHTSQQGNTHQRQHAAYKEGLADVVGLSRHADHPVTAPGQGFATNP